MSVFSRLMSPARRNLIYFIAAVIVVALFVLLAESLHEIGFPLDDAWIHQTYARNLAEYGEWSFIPGEASAASTAPLYSALLAIGHILGLAPFVWTYFLGVLALTLAASNAARIAEQLFPAASPLVSFATGLAVLMTWQMVWAAASGMETMLFMALSLVVMRLAFQYLDSQINPDVNIDQPINHFKSGLFLGIIGGLLTLTRPEGVVLVGITGLMMLIALGLRQNYLLWAIGVSMGWLIVVSPYALWNYNLTGELLPSTADAKITEYAFLREQSLPTRYFNLLKPLLIGGQLFGLPGILWGIGLVGQRTRQNRTQIFFLLPLIWALTHLTIFAIRLPANYQYGRYVMPMLPPLLLYMAGGYADLLRRWRYRPIGRITSRAFAAGTAVAFLLFLWIGGQAYARDVRLINTEMVETAKWVNAEIPPDELLAVHDIGALGYYAPREIVDLAGLVTPEIVPLMEDSDAMLEFVCDQGAQWLMVLPDQLARLTERDDPRLELVYESPYDFMNQAHGETELGTWKMRVYRLDCETRTDPDA